MCPFLIALPEWSFTPRFTSLVQFLFCMEQTPINKGAKNPAHQYLDHVSSNWIVVENSKKLLTTLIGPNGKLSQNDSKS